MKAALYRSRRAASQPPKYEHGSLSVDLQTGSVVVDGEETYLTPLEYKLLAALVERAGRVVAHQTLMHRVWGRQHENHRHYLKLYIWYLRQKLEPDPAHPQFILTERGSGYYLVAPD